MLTISNGFWPGEWYWMTKGEGLYTLEMTMELAWMTMELAWQTKLRYVIDIYEWYPDPDMVIDQPLNLKF